MEELRKLNFDKLISVNVPDVRAYTYNQYKSNNYEYTPINGYCVSCEEKGCNVYFKQDGAFRNETHAYLNLTRMREEYSLLHCKGAKEAFLFMSADWAPTTVKT